MTHARVHVRFGTFDVVMEVISEVLDVADCGLRYRCIGEMAREQDECDISDILGLR